MDTDIKTEDISDKQRYTQQEIEDAWTDIDIDFTEIPINLTCKYLEAANRNSSKLNALKLPKERKVSAQEFFGLVKKDEQTEETIENEPLNSDNNKSLQRDDEESKEDEKIDRTTVYERLKASRGLILEPDSEQMTKNLQNHFRENMERRAAIVISHIQTDSVAETQSKKTIGKNIRNDKAHLSYINARGRNSKSVTKLIRMYEDSDTGTFCCRGGVCESDVPHFWFLIPKLRDLAKEEEPIFGCKLPKENPKILDGIYMVEVPHILSVAASMESQIANLKKELQNLKRRIEIEKNNGSTDGEIENLRLEIDNIKKKEIEEGGQKISENIVVNNDPDLVNGESHDVDFLLATQTKEDRKHKKIPTEEEIANAKTEEEREALRNKRNKVVHERDEEDSVNDNLNENKEAQDDPELNPEINPDKEPSNGTDFSDEFSSDNEEEKESSKLPAEKQVEIQMIGEERVLTQSEKEFKEIFASRMKPNK